MGAQVRSLGPLTACRRDPVGRENRLQDGPALGQASGLRCAGPELHGLALGVRRAGLLGTDAAGPQPDHGPCCHGACRFLTARHRLKQVHRRMVGEVGHHHFGQFPRGLGHVERGSDTAAHLVEEREPALGPMAVGDVLDHLGHTQDAAGGILQPEGRDQRDPFPCRILLQANELLGVDQRSSRLHHLAHTVHSLARVVGEEHPAGGHPLKVRCRDAAEPFDGPIDPEDPLVGTVDDQADRALAVQTVENRAVPLPFEDVTRECPRKKPLTAPVTA
ncbi:hypothetical protein GCM10011428_17830 [Streptomyces violaceus]